MIQCRWKQKGGENGDWFVEIQDPVSYTHLDVYKRQVLEQVKDELTKIEPKKSRLQNCIKIIAPMITIANGIPGLAINLQKFQDFIIQYISKL